MFEFFYLLLLRVKLTDSMSLISTFAQPNLAPFPNFGWSYSYFFSELMLKPQSCNKRLMEQKHYDQLKVLIRPLRKHHFHLCRYIWCYIISGVFFFFLHLVFIMLYIAQNLLYWLVFFIGIKFFPSKWICLYLLSVCLFIFKWMDLML